jgi:hypothetical protein
VIANLFLAPTVNIGSCVCVHVHVCVRVCAYVPACVRARTFVCADKSMLLALIIGMVPFVCRQVQAEANERRVKFLSLQRGYKATEDRLREQLEQAQVSEPRSIKLTRGVSDWLQH